MLGQIMQLYRINIRTARWPVRVIMHFFDEVDHFVIVDLAIIAAWME